MQYYMEYAAAARWKPAIASVSIDIAAVSAACRRFGEKFAYTSH